MAQNPEMLNNEEFEKVDPYQDENISSTSMTGEMAEEDRYQGDAVSGGSLLDDEYTSTAGQPAAYREESDPLISFDPSPPPAPIPETTVTEPTPPPTAKSEPEPTVTGGLMAVPGFDAMGAWLENVDPRGAESKEELMASPENLADSSTERKASSGVVELIYWRDVRKTGIVFGSMMFVLISLACFSLLSVLAYMSICVLTVTFTFRVYKSIMQAVQKTNEGHPFKWDILIYKHCFPGVVIDIIVAAMAATTTAVDRLAVLILKGPVIILDCILKLLEMNIELKDEVVQDAAENIAKHLNCCHRELRRLYLVEDYVDSVKFGMMLWLLTYIGSWFSGMTLIILVVVSIFTLPRVYETYKVQIDQYINMARAQLNKILAQISAKIPFPKKKAKTQ